MCLHFNGGTYVYNTGTSGGYTLELEVLPVPHCVKSQIHV